MFHRGNNLVATAIVALSGFAFFPEFFLEDEWQYKIDEGLLFLLGLGAIGSYFKGKNRFKRSIAPIIFVVIALIIKIVAIVIEHKDKEDVGDDVGALVLFVCATIFVIWLYIKSKKFKETA